MEKYGKQKAEESPAEKFRRMTETPVKRLVYTLAVPTIISMLITSVYNMADAFSHFTRLTGTEEASFREGEFHLNTEKNIKSAIETEGMRKPRKGIVPARILNSALCVTGTATQRLSIPRF